MNPGGRPIGAPPSRCRPPSRRPCPRVARGAARPAPSGVPCPPPDRTASGRVRATSGPAACRPPGCVAAHAGSVGCGVGRFSDSPDSPGSPRAAGPRDWPPTPRQPEPVRRAVLENWRVWRVWGPPSAQHESKERKGKFPSGAHGRSREPRWGQLLLANHSEQFITTPSIYAAS